MRSWFRGERNFSIETIGVETNLFGLLPFQGHLVGLILRVTT
jgi:hypothetical protein